MEEVHGVDVSWLHHAGRDNQNRKSIPISPAFSRDQDPPNPSYAGVPHHHRSHSGTNVREGHRPQPSPAQPAAPKVTEPEQREKGRIPTTALPANSPTPSPTSDGRNTGAKVPLVKRPGLLGRSNSERRGQDNPRRPSWINNLSSKFSSSQAMQPLPQTPPPTSSPLDGQVAPRQVTTGGAGLAGQSQAQANSSGPTAAYMQHIQAGGEEIEPYIPAKPKDAASGGSFFSSLTRRLSSAGGPSPMGSPRVTGNGGMCPRRVLNVDPNRPRCMVPELDQNKLRRVSFCVDVEIAGGPRYYKDDGSLEDEGERSKKRQNAKMKEKGEGAALKNPGAMQEAKENDEEERKDGPNGGLGERPLSGDQVAQPATDTVTRGAPAQGKSTIRMVAKEDPTGSNEDLGSSPPHDGDEEARMARKKEKKQRSEVERKQRKENRRRRAEEQGLSPVELKMRGDSDSSRDASPTRFQDAQETLSLTPPTGSNAAALTRKPVPPSASLAAAEDKQKQDKPTTDPVRIYRRCCQLRETPILKRITEQLMSPKSVTPGQPGVVSCLDLTGSRLQLADVVTLGDWLAVVPVKRILLEDADLNDEGVRVVLSGLLAAKKPEPTRRKAPKPMHREGIAPQKFKDERTGIVEKITFKNNARITRVGWKHISLFLYMCRSLKALDISMNPFPATLPSSASVTPTKLALRTVQGAARSNNTRQHPQDVDAAETLFKCLSERLGGSKLEELSVSECSLNSLQVRKVVDGAIMCGVTRLGLAGNALDEDGLTHVIHYLRSGVCQGLDLGANDLRGRLGMISSALADSAKLKELPCWGLSLAGCNLEAKDVKTLFPILVQMPDFRFIDLSHNRDLCTGVPNPREPPSSSNNSTFIALLRRYIPQLKNLKRIHLADVGMSPKQVIALAEVLPECPKLAHINFLENLEVAKLASAMDEAGQEEACAVYASLMAAVKISKTVICVDIDVPSPETNEVVKALAKQVVAYCLHNMEHFAFAEVTGAGIISSSNAMAQIVDPYGGEKNVKDVIVPDVLMHLIGHVDGISENHDGNGPAPDDDYIVGGTGVVKALQYVLGEKVNGLRRRPSAPTTPTGSTTPAQRPGSAAGPVEKGKAKEMSQYLLGSARKIRARLQPALIQESGKGDELAYRRLLFLDQTLQGIVQRFEEEYPETRVMPALSTLPKRGDSLQPRGTVLDKQPQNVITPGGMIDRKGLLPSLMPENSMKSEGGKSDSSDEDDLGDSTAKSAIKRQHSDVSLASRSMTHEEGQLHRLGHHLRRSIVDTPSSPGFGPSSPALSPTGDSPQNLRRLSRPEEEARLKELGEKIESLSGAELKSLVEKDGWQHVFSEVGANFEDLRTLQEQDPVAWKLFEESQMKARMNVGDQSANPGNKRGNKRNGMVF